MGGVPTKIDRNWQLLKLSVGQIEAHYTLFFFFFHFGVCFKSSIT